MRRRIGLTLAVVACLILALSLVVFPSCGAQEGEKPIKIGLIFELTGPGSDYGPESIAGIELRLDEANWQVAGRPVQIVIEDNATDPSTTIEKAKKLVELDKVDIMMGPNFSDSQLAMAPYLKEQGILALGPFSTPYEIKDYGNWISSPGTIYSISIAMGDWIYDQGWRTVTTMAADYTAGYTMIGGPAERFVERGGQWTQQQWIPYGTVDYSPYIVALKDADGIMLWTTAADMTLLLNQLLQMEPDMPVVVVGAGSMKSPQLAAIGDNLFKVAALSVDYTRNTDYPANQRFAKALKEKKGLDAETASAGAYTGMSIFLAGLEKTGGDPSLEKLYPAILGLELETPYGPMNFTKNAFGNTWRYLANVEVIDGVYQYVPFQIIEDEGIDPRETGWQRPSWAKE